MNQQEIINTIALTRLNYFSLPGLLQLYKKVGSATEIMVHRNDIRAILPDASPRLIDALTHLDDALQRATAEYTWAEEQHVKPICFNDDRYPQRLRDCDDAPLMLFLRGNADLNSRRMVSIVGTRHATNYGHDLTDRFVGELATLCPDTVIVSGLAYGIDIMAHRAALNSHLPTIAVLAHGLDELYPSAHRHTATQMLEHGGLLTEFTSATRIDKKNFVQRNRIVAGMADAVVLVESAATGGGLITTSIARSYNREVFAFPGRVDAPYSEGCNQLIRDNGAALITSALDFAKAMGWDDDVRLQSARQQGIERQLFVNLSPDEQQVVDALKKQNDQQINLLSVNLNMPIAQLSATLFTLEMQGLVRTLPGAVYHLIS